jgi:hypothetical protein
MTKPMGFRPWLKGLLFWVAFLLLTGLGKLLPFIPVTLFSAVNESTFQHFKATFFAYLLVSLVEYLVYRERIGQKSAFWYARLLAAVIAPWIVFLIWYQIAAVYGPLNSVVLEIIYGNIVTLLVGLIAATFEDGFEQISFNRSLKGLVWLLVIFSVILYTVFSFRLPWVDVFIEADWQETSNLLWRFHV